MLKVWGRATSANVQKVMWAVAEMGIAHERIDVGGAFGGLDTPAYLQMNPNGLIPTIQDDGVVVWESHAIVRYLASKHGRGTLWAEDAGLRARGDMWMDWVATTAQPALTAAFVGLVRTAPSKQDAGAIAAAGERLGKIFGLLDGALSDRDFLAGDQLGIGDIAVGALLYRYFELELQRPALPYVEAWYQALQQRAAYRDHVMVSFDGMRVKDA